jgi:NAD(P)-dependent dehydrogenase (short-subunit alcohol dehydrogenase family)
VTASFEGKVALVTGAASGIGEATAVAFAVAGASVVLADVTEDAGAELAERLSRAGHAAAFVRADVTEVDDVAAMVAFAVERFGTLDYAANVAGGSAGGDRPGLGVLDTTPEQWDGTMGLNARATYLCLRAEIGHMRDHGGGAIANVASVAGYIGRSEGSVSYSVAKAAVAHLTRRAAADHARDGVRVNAIVPGLTATPAVLRSLTPEQRVPRGHLIKRAVEPSEQAAAILFLCSDDAAMITGHCLPVDGGWLAR